MNITMKPFMRVVLDEMPQDPDPIEPGEQATVVGYDRAGHLMVNWDNGRTFNLILGVDKFHVMGLSASPATDPSTSQATALGAVVEKADKEGPGEGENVEKNGPERAGEAEEDELDRSFTWLCKLQHDLPEGNSSKCPRCGKPFNAHRGALSRRKYVMVCDLCGQQEAIEDYLKGTKGMEVKPIEDWYIVKIWQGGFEENE